MGSVPIAHATVPGIWGSEGAPVEGPTQRQVALYTAPSIRSLPGASELELPFLKLALLSKSNCLKYSYCKYQLVSRRLGGCSRAILINILLTAYIPEAIAGVSEWGFVIYSYKYHSDNAWKKFGRQLWLPLSKNKFRNRTNIVTNYCRPKTSLSETTTYLKRTPAVKLADIVAPRF